MESLNPYKAVVAAMRRLNVGSDHLRSTMAASLGIGPADLRALSLVLDSGEMTPKELAGLLDITTGSTTAMIDRLEKAALLVRHPHPTDRRSILLSLTPAGRHAVQWVHDVVAGSIEQAYGSSGMRSVEEDVAFLTKVAEGLEQEAAVQHSA